MTELKTSRRRFLGALRADGAAVATAGVLWSNPAQAQASGKFTSQTIAYWSFLSPEGKGLREVNARVAGSLPARKSVLAQPFFQTKESA